MTTLLDVATVTITVREIELIALKKLSLVSHALADKIGGRSADEQRCLVTVLDDIVRQIELKRAIPASDTGRDQ